MGRRSDAFYCDERCRSRARRRRSRGLPSSSYPGGWRRGRLTLGTKTKRERELEAVRADALREAKSELAKYERFARALAKYRASRERR